MADTMKPVEDVDVKETSSDDNCLAIAQHMSTEEFREAEKKLKRKLDVRLLACMWLIFILNYLDRNNIATAKVAGLSDSLNLTSTQYSTAVAILFVGYVLMQLPSNIFLANLRPSWYIPGVMAVWGMLSALVDAVHNAGGLYALRFLLGFLEAAFYPGALFLISSWYKREEMGVRSAAERKRSAAILQLFPWTLHFQGPEFVRYVVRAAHTASVPVAVHLDHCIKPEDVELALTLPFDSIMIDASTLDDEANIRHSKAVVDCARAFNITIEAEMGRIEGGEDGLPTVDMESVMTRPEDAERFVQQTGVHFLAPSFGNIHGGYPAGGAEEAWDLSRLAAIGKSVSESTPLALHGTHPVSDELFQKTIRCGMRKINLNRTVRDDYTKFVAENAGSQELTTLKVQGVEIYAKSIERMMDVLGSSGRY